MSEDQEKEHKPEYNLDEILAEYGSGKYGHRPKVVEFPEREGSPVPPADKPPVQRDRGEAAAVQACPSEEKKPSAPVEGTPIPEIMPDSLGRRIGAQLSTLLRRADHFADHMYDQAEPDEVTCQAKQYLPPTTDQEEPPIGGDIPHRAHLRTPKRPVDPPLILPLPNWPAVVEGG